MKYKNIQFFNNLYNINACLFYLNYIYFNNQLPTWWWPNGDNLSYYSRGQDFKLQKAFSFFPLGEKAFLIFLVQWSIKMILVACRCLWYKYSIVEEPCKKSYFFAQLTMIIFFIVSPVTTVAWDTTKHSLKYLQMNSEYHFGHSSATK